MRLLVRCAQARHGAGRCRAAETTPCYAGCAAVLALGSRRKTHFTRCARFVRTVAASQLWKRASTRADPRAAFLAVAYAARHRPAPCLAGEERSWGRVVARCGHRARTLPRAAGAQPGEGRARCPALALLQQRTGACLAKPWAGVRWRACAAARSTGFRSARVPARFAHLTRRNCLSATNAVSEASFAARPKPEHRSAVGAPLAPTAAVARQRTPAHGLAIVTLCAMHAFKVSNGPQTARHRSPSHNSLTPVAAIPV